LENGQWPTVISSTGILSFPMTAHFPYLGTDGLGGASLLELPGRVGMFGLPGVLNSGLTGAFAVGRLGRLGTPLGFGGGGSIMS